YRVHMHLELEPEPKSDEPPPDPDLRKLTLTKANAARRGETVELRWSDGVFVSAAQPADFDFLMNRPDPEEVFLDLLAEIRNQKRHVSASKHASNYAPKFFAKRPPDRRQKYVRKDFEEAMERLFASNRIKVAEYGRPSDQREEIVASDP